jgi:hypothetical protein
VNSSGRRKFERAVKREVEKRGQGHIPSSNEPTSQPVSNVKQSPSIVTKIPKLGIRGWRLIGILATILGLVGGFLRFDSDITITPRVRLDPVDPFSTLFTVTNDGVFPIKNVTFSCHMNYVEIHNYRFAVHDQDGSIDPKGGA